MGEKGRYWDKISLDREIRRLASRQYGHVTRQQLLKLGLGPRGVTYRIHAGTLIPVHAGVYAVGAVREDAPARAQAAVLACGEEARLSHSAAAALWGFRPWPRIMEVTIPGDRRRPGIRTHRSRTLTSADRRTHNGIRTTSPARAVLDIAPGLTDAQLARAVNDARHEAKLRLPQLHELLARCPSHPGAARLRPFVERPSGPTRSEFEDAFLAMVRRFGLPEPMMGARVGPYEVDALFPEQRVIVELDGWEFHDDRGAFVSDRERDTANLAMGYRTVRITWDRLTQRPAGEAQRLLAILELAA